MDVALGSARPTGGRRQSNHGFAGSHQKTSHPHQAHALLTRPTIYRSSRSHGATPTPFVLTTIGTGILVLLLLLVGRGDLGTGEIRPAGAVSFQRRLGSLQGTRANQRGWAPRKGTVGHSREERASTSAGNGRLYVGGKEGYKPGMSCTGREGSALMAVVRLTYAYRIPRCNALRFTILWETVLICLST